MIHLECDNDEALIRGLGVARKNIVHHGGKPRVAKALELASGSSITGMVDEDPGSVPPPYLKQFQVDENLGDLGLKRYVHPKTRTWLIEISPDLEPWLYKAAQKAGLKPKDYGLPESYKDLHHYPKNYSARLTEFVKQMASKGSRHILALQKWI